MIRAKILIERLRREIREHNRRYYVDCNPVISDEQYDMLVKKLEQLESEYPEYADPGSPTNTVGSDI